MSRGPLYGCGRCRKPRSAWGEGKLCRDCQKAARAERAADPNTESLRDFRARLKGTQ